MENNHDNVLKDAQYRKGLSIAYFNSLNASIELAKVMFPDMEGVDTKAFISEWRDYFLEEHKNYYANVIAKVGTNYKPEVAKTKLINAKSIDELKVVWQSLSEDERRDKDIIILTQSLKKKYEKA